MDDISTRLYLAAAGGPRERLSLSVQPPVAGLPPYHRTRSKRKACGLFRSTANHVL